MANPASPRVIALILCEQIIEDKETNNKTLIGLFNRITTHKIPYAHPRIAILVSLVDGRGKVPISVRLVHVETEKEVFNLKGQADFKDPTETADLVLDIRGVPLNSTGLYAIEVLSHNELVGERRFSVVHVPREE